MDIFETCKQADCFTPLNFNPRSLSGRIFLVLFLQFLLLFVVSNSRFYYLKSEFCLKPCPWKSVMGKVASSSVCGVKA